jgi:N-acetylneuraminate synthase
MHCVAIYPTPDEHLNLRQIRQLTERYPGKMIGFSTHESPNDFEPVQVAAAQGARLFERHVGIPTTDAPLNAYSSTPEQIGTWIAAAERALVLCGPRERPAATAKELQSLRELQRGVFARVPLKPGTPVESSDVYFAMPLAEGQLASGEWKPGLVLTAPVEKDAPLLLSALESTASPDKNVLFTSIHTTKAMLNEARIALPTEFDTEFSHHYGLSKFNEVGIIMITCVNRAYCKKLVIQMAGQRHPLHYHKRKEETFQVLHGILELEIEGRHRTLYPGDIQLVQQGTWHEFWTKDGAIFEEISTTHVPNDSFYQDPVINAAGSARKTVVNQWGRYQI